MSAVNILLQHQPCTFTTTAETRLSGCSECPSMGGCCAGRVAAGACIELSEEVLKEAQIGAIYALYAAYYTQQSKPIVRIYMSPAHVTALRKLLPVRIAAAVTSE